MHKKRQTCKVIFALQLLVSWLVVVGAGAYADEMSDGYNMHAVFGLAVAFSVLVSLDGMLNPKHGGGSSAAVPCRCSQSFGATGLAQALSKSTKAAMTLRGRRICCARC